MRPLLAVTIAMLFMSACSFPDVEFSSGVDAAADAQRDGQDPLGDASDSGDAPNSGDAGDGGKKDATPDPCDKDGDGFAAKGACGGLDCDDNDARRNPGVSRYLTFPTADGDWNCNAIVEKQFFPGVNCGAILGQAQCNAATGFSGDPACGAVSPTYVTCEWNLVAVPPLCVLKSTTSQTQGCQ